MASLGFDRSTGWWRVKHKVGQTEHGKSVWKTVPIVKHEGIPIPYPKGKREPKPPRLAETALEEYKAKEHQATLRADVPVIAPLELEPFLAARLASVELTGVASSVRNAKCAIQSFLAFAGERGIKTAARVTIDDAREWMESLLREGKKRSTIVKRKDILAVAWRQAVESGKLSKNPFALAKVPGKKIVEPPPYWTEAEFDKLAAVVKPWVRDLITVLVHCGLRIESALCLRWGDIDWVHDVIRVRAEISKTGIAYSAPLLGPVRDILQPKDPGRPDELVFVGVQSGKKLTQQLTFKTIKRAVKRAGIPDYGHYNHIFRHSFATWAVQRGVPLKIVSTWLGHQSIKTTEIYAHVETRDTQHWAAIFIQRAPGQSPP